MVFYYINVTGFVIFLHIGVIFMIDIIIPAYNAHRFIGQTLASIAFQDCVDLFNVYIVNDCSEKDYSEFVSYFSNFMNVKELTLDVNVGPGQARQFGIDNSNSEYILFVDSDDVLSDNFAVSRLYNALINSEYDISASGFYEEKEFGFIFHGLSYVWMHAKLYRRSFLINNNICFNKTRCNEDCGFNHLCYLCGASYIEVPGVSYIWKNNLNSITHINQGETFRKNVKSYVDNMIWSLTEAKKRKYDNERFENIVYGTIVSNYHYFLQNEDVFEDGELFKKLSILVKFYDEFSMDDIRRMNIIKSQIISELSGPDLIKVYDPRYTLNDFIDMLRSSMEVEK